jgi:hypothetical protein
VRFRLNSIYLLVNTIKYLRYIILFVLVGMQSGCESFGRGVAEAVLNNEVEDTKICHVEGPKSEGLNAFLTAQEIAKNDGSAERPLKILSVHGIGEHLPGYSGRITNNLVEALNLDVRDLQTKKITLRDPEFGEEDIGILTLSRFTNKQRTRTVLFYELTWSSITDEEKKIIAFDDTVEHSFRRASLNATLKEFFNSNVSDTLVYLGEPRKKIHSSVRQSFCWMTSSNWENYEEIATKSCDLQSVAGKMNFLDEDYVVISHSLGSRIVLDTAVYFRNLSQQQGAASVVTRDDNSDISLRLYMLANQLPLLELGRERAAVRGEISSYCRPAGENYQNNFINKFPIYAFSDPNDILSYSIPPQFANEYLDSRLCPEITNVTINVTQPVSLLGFGSFARPDQAHSNYDNDDRVIAMIANGIGTDQASPIVQEKCTWLEAINIDE